MYKIVYEDLATASQRGCTYIARGPEKQKDVYDVVQCTSTTTDFHFRCTARLDQQDVRQKFNYHRHPTSPRCTKNIKKMYLTCTSTIIDQFIDITAEIRCTGQAKAGQVIAVRSITSLCLAY